jgi:hypothetical protein
MYTHTQRERERERERYEFCHTVLNSIAPKQGWDLLNRRHLPKLSGSAGNGLFFVFY